MHPEGSLPKWDMLDVIYTSIVRSFHILMNETTASTSKGLNGKVFALLHFCLVTIVNNGNRLASVDLVRVDRVSVQVTDRLDLICLALNLNLVRLHDFLDGGTNIAQSHVNTSLLDSSVGRILDSSQQVIVNRVEGERESRVNDSSCNTNTYSGY